MTENRAEKILQTLRKNFTPPSWVTSDRDPFKTMIITIISQNTADRNTARAFEKLSNNPRSIGESGENKNGRIFENRWALQK